MNISILAAGAGGMYCGRQRVVAHAAPAVHAAGAGREDADVHAGAPVPVVAAVVVVAVDVLMTGAL